MRSLLCNPIAVLMTACTIFFLASCISVVAEEEDRTEGTEEATMALRTCGPSTPPMPIQSDWTQAKANKHNARPSGKDFPGLWIVAVWKDPCTGSPPALEVDWIKGTSVDSLGRRAVIYDGNKPGETGLWPSSYELGYRDATHWFKRENGLPGWINASTNLTGDVARFQAPNACTGYVAVHTFIGERKTVPSDVTDIIVECKVRVTGNMVVMCGYDWYATATGGANPTEGSFSDWVGNDCSTDWMIIRSWDPATGIGSAQTDLVPQPAPIPPPTQPGKVTVDFTVTNAGLPVSSFPTVYRKGIAWQQLAVTNTGTNSYRAEATSFDPAADVLVIKWLSNGAWKYGCGLPYTNGPPNLYVSTNATDASGKRYSGIAKSYGTGCDVQLTAQTTPTSPPPQPAPQPWVYLTQGNVADGSSYVRSPDTVITLGWKASQSVNIYVEQLASSWTVWRTAAVSAPATGTQPIAFYSDWPIGQKLRLRLDAGSAKAYTGWFTLQAPAPAPVPQNGALTVDFTVAGSATPVSSMQAFRKNATTWQSLAVTGTGGASYRTQASSFAPGTDVLVIQWLSNGAWKNGCMRSNGINQLLVSASATGANGSRYYGYAAPTTTGCDVGLR